MSEKHDPIVIPDPSSNWANDGSIVIDKGHDPRYD